MDLENKTKPEMRSSEAIPLWKQLIFNKKNKTGKLRSLINYAFLVEHQAPKVALVEKPTNSLVDDPNDDDVGWKIEHRKSVFYSGVETFASN